MGNGLKKIDKKYLVMTGIIFGVIILVVIILVVIKIISGRNLSPEKIETKLLEAAQDYVEDGKIEAPANGDSVVITDKELVAAEYLKDLTEYNEEAACSGKVTVMNNGGLAFYIPDLQCKEYKTTHLREKIIEQQLVEEEIIDGTYQFGLYAVDDEYIFKGKDVDNFVSFGGVTWRIIKIDSNGNLKLIKTTPEGSIAWDNKYNSDIGKYYGLNDYANSFLFETLKADYESFKDENKKHLVMHDVCIGKRKNFDLEKNDEFECSTVLENQYISTLSAIDVAMASLDPDCTQVVSRSCANYNYMSMISSWTVNSFADSTYQAFVVSGGIVGLEQTNKKNDYYWVVYVSGDELYHMGSGTADDPYIIK